MAAATRGASGWRPSPRVRRVALWLWIAAVVVVWNGVFDRAVTAAEDRYVAAALAASRLGGAPPRIDDWLRPAVSAAAWHATAVAGALLTVGLAALGLAWRAAGAA